MFKNFILGLLLTLVAIPALAVDFQFANEFSGGVDCSNSATGCATLSVTAIDGGVHYQLNGTMTGTEFITGVYGNVDPFSGFVITNTSGNAFEGFGVGTDGYKADGDGYFDWVVNFQSAAGDGRFSGTDTFGFDILGISLEQAILGVSQNGPVGKNGFSFALHGQGLVNGGSGWFNGVELEPRCTDCEPNPNEVPESGTLALLSAGLLGLGVVRRRKSVDG